MDVTTSKLRIRNVARVILVNDDGEILLVRHSDKAAVNPDRPDVLIYWIPPGGGVEDRETFEQAAIRELQEETGIVIETVERCILLRNFQMNYAGELVNENERFFLSRISEKPTLSKFKPNEVVVDARWCSLAEIENSSDSFFPASLAELMRNILGS
jgi:8-oxo-dGTP pyrophosphatase MutT (NUDIX family)